MNKTFRTEEDETPAPAITRQQRNDTIDSGYSQRRAAQYKTIANAARKAGDMANAAFWDGQIMNPDYSRFPPGMTRLRLLEIAGTVSADAPVRSDEGNAYLRGVLVQVLMRIIRCAESPELRLDAIDEDASVFEKNFARALIRAAGGREGELRVDAAEAEAANKVKDAWDSQWKQPPKSAELLGAGNKTDAERHDEATEHWGGEWKAPPRSDVFVASWKKEPARNGGMGISDDMRDEER